MSLLEWNLLPGASTNSWLSLQKCLVSVDGCLNKETQNWKPLSRFTGEKKNGTICGTYIKWTLNMHSNIQFLLFSCSIMPNSLQPHWLCSQWLLLLQITDCSPPGSPVNGILQARILERVAISFSSWSSQPWDRIINSCIQFSGSVMSDCLQPYRLQLSRFPCQSQTPGAYSNSCPSSRWCHPTISSSVVPFSSCLQRFPASGSFPMTQFLAWGGQSIGASASASVLPKNIQDWFPLGWTHWISLQSKRLSRVFSNITVQKHQFFALSFLYSPTLRSIHDYWKNHSFE